MTEEQYNVTRKGAFGPAFNGALWDDHRDGVDRSIGSDQPLFDSHNRFESGIGWPSIFHPASEEALETHEDDSYDMHRIEVTCARSNAHLGHVFSDGPKPSGQRYCINILNGDDNYKKHACHRLVPAFYCCLKSPTLQPKQ